MTYALVTSTRSQNFYSAPTVPSHYGEPRVVKGITIHWWGDPAAHPTFEQTVAYLCRPGGNTSAHFVVEDGRVAPIVNTADAAWHAGSAQGNAETIGIECNPRQSDGDYATIAALIADLRVQYGDLPLYPHRHWFATTCPGTYDLARLDQLARGASTVGNTLATGGTVTPPPTITPPTPLTALAHTIEESAMQRQVIHNSATNTFAIIGPLGSGVRYVIPNQGIADVAIKLYGPAIEFVTRFDFDLAFELPVLGKV